jgi:hypothetical protein
LGALHCVSLTDPFKTKAGTGEVRELRWTTEKTPGKGGADPLRVAGGEKARRAW